VPGDVELRSLGVAERDAPAVERDVVAAAEAEADLAGVATTVVNSAALAAYAACCALRPTRAAHHPQRPDGCAHCCHYRMHWQQ
jgi:hypothetical protein